MSKKGKIITLMLNDHGKIISLLNNFESTNERDSEIYFESFNQFKWELKRHIIVEETAIFTYYNPESEEDYSMVPKLEKDHKEISKMIEEIEDSIKNSENADISNLKDFLKSHKQYEEDVFYPTLERELDEAQKKKIIDHINAQM